MKADNWKTIVSELTSRHWADYCSWRDLPNEEETAGAIKSGYHAARHRLENLPMDQPDADLYRQGINSLAEALESCRASSRDRNGFECAVYKDVIEQLQTRLAPLDGSPEG
jgi:hypothetical protein